MKTAGKVILICGKIGSGKTTYAKRLIHQTHAVLLSQDELMLTLFTRDFYHENYEFYNQEVDRANEYTKALAVKVARGGADVILDNGFWSRDERREYAQYYENHGIECEIYYMDIPEDIRIRNVRVRNEQAREGNNRDFIVKESDICHYFEEPDESEKVIRVSWESRVYDNNDLLTYVEI